MLPWSSSPSGRSLCLAALLLLHGIVLYALLGAVVLPKAAKAVIERDVSRLLHRPVSVGSLWLNPFTFEMGARRVAIMEPEGDRIFLGFDRFEVNVDLALAINQRFGVSRLLLEKPVVRLARNNRGALNFADLLPAPAPANPESSEPIELLPPGVSLALRDITVSDGTVIFEDDLAGARQELNNLQFSITLLSSDQSGLRDAFTAGGTLNEANILLDVKADPFAKSPEAEVRLTMKNVAISRYSPYLPVSKTMNLSIAETGAWARISFPGLQSGRSVPVLEGNARLADISIGSGDATDVRLESLEVHGVSLDMETARFSVERVDINTPDVSLVRDPQGVLNLLALLDRNTRGQAEAHASASVQAPAPAPGQTPAEKAPTPVADAPTPASSTASTSGKGSVSGQAPAADASVPAPSAAPVAAQATAPAAAPAQEPASGAQTHAPSAATSASALPASEQTADHTQTSVPAPATAPAPAVDKKAVPVSAGKKTPATASAPAVDAAPSATASDLPDVHVGEVVVKNARLEIDDQSIGAKTVLKGLNGTLEGLELAAGTFDSLRLECEGDIFEHLKLKAKGSFAPLHIEGDFALDGLELVKPGAVLKHLLPQLAFSGLAGVDAQFSLSERNGEVLPRVLGTVTVENLRLGQENQTPMLAAHKLTLTGIDTDPAANTLSLDQVNLSGGDIRLALDGQGRLVLPQAFATQSGQERQGGGLKWRVKDIQTENTHLELADARTQAVYTADLEKAGAKNLDSGLDKPIALHVQGRLGQEASLAVSGEVTLKTLSATLHLEASGLPLEELARLAPPLPVALKKGEIRLAGDIVASLGGPTPQGGFTGDIGLKDLLLAAPGAEGGDLLRLPELALTGVAAKLSPLEVRVAGLTLTDPVLFLEVDKDGMPLLPGVSQPSQKTGGTSSADASAGTGPGGPASDGVKGKLAAGSRKASAEAGPGTPASITGPGNATPAIVPGKPGKPGLALAYGLGAVTVKGGRLELSAKGFEPPLTASISAIQASLTDIKPDQPCKVSLSALVGQSGKFKAEGQAGWVASAPMLDLRVTLENMDLGELSPVSQKFTGFPITRGKLRLLLDYKADKSALNLKNKIVVMGIQLGRKTAVPGGKDVPLDLAVSLLADSKGVIDLDIPITGETGKMKVDLQDVISTAMAGAFAKILFSPLAFLNVGHGGGRTAGVGFTPGTAELTAEGKKTLSDLAQAIAKRPRLNLEVMAYVDFPAEAGAMAQALAAKAAQTAGAAGASPEAPASKKGVFGKGAAKQTAKAAVQAAPPPVKPPSAEDAQNLARQRQDAVWQFLTSQAQLSEQRIFTMSGNHLAPPKMQGVPDSRADVTLRQ